MNRSVRSMATSLAIGFAVYFAARAIWWVEEPLIPPLLVVAVLLYLVVLVTCVLLASAATVRLPQWAAVLAVAATVGVVIMANVALAPEDRTSPFATWYIGAIGLLGTICVVRRRPLCGWLVLAVLIVGSTAHLGVAGALRLGLLGSIVWIALGQVLVLFWERAVRDTERLADIQRAVSGWQSAQQVRRHERRVLVREALATAGPVLTRTVAARGCLTDAEREQARLAEGRLRDEIRAAALLDDDVRAAIEALRRRGSDVTVLDQGGLDGLDEVRRGRIRARLAAELREARAARIIIRSAHDARTAVTVVGRSAAGESSDEDDVELWVEIPRDAG